nr:hypothetical protein [Methylobacterium sp. ZNC0032]
MATFGEVLEELKIEDIRRQSSSAFDRVRRRHIKALHELTGRNVVVYYSGWLHRDGQEHFHTTSINDEDKHGFMAAFAGLSFDKGLDLILHTPGGDVAATESIIDYIRSKFGNDVRVIVPQISMSGGTMIALSAREIVMGRHSNLGPIDPQFGGIPAIAILEEFDRARTEILADPNTALVWQPILSQYGPTLLSVADQSIKWARSIGTKAVRDGMLHGEADAAIKAAEIVEFMLSQDLHHAHGRHIHRNELKDKGVKIIDLEDDPALQDAVLTVHHACMLTVGNANANKLIENHNGIAHVKMMQMMVVNQPNAITLPQNPALPPAAAPAPAPLPVQLSFFDRLKLAFKVLFGAVTP